MEKLSGIPPIKLHWVTHSNFKLFRFPNSVGKFMGENGLYAKTKLSRLTKFPNSEGNVPLNKFEPKFKVINPLSFPIELGISPVKLLELRSRYCS